MNCQTATRQALLIFMPTNKSQTVLVFPQKISYILNSHKQNTKWLSTFKFSLRLFVRFVSLLECE